MVDQVTYFNGYLPGWVYFLTSLNAPLKLLKAYVYFLTSMNYAAKTAQAYVYFLTSMNYAAKTARILRLFFNKHELYAKTARYISHVMRASQWRLLFFKELHLSCALLLILSLCKLGND